MKKIPFIVFGTIVLVISICAIITIYSTLFEPYYNKEYEKEMISRNEQITETAEIYILHYLEYELDLIRNLESLTHNSFLTSAELEDIYDDFAQSNEYIETLDVLDQDGYVIYSVENIDLIGYSYHDHHLYQSIENLHEPVIGGIHFNNQVQDLVLEVLYPTETGSIITTISIDFFEEYGKSMTEVFPDYEFQILQKDGIFVYDSENYHHEIRFRTYLFEEYKQIEKDNTNEINIEGEEAIVSVRKVENTEWYIVSYIYSDTAFALREILETYFIYLVITIIVILTGVYIFIEVSLVNELKRLINKFKSLSNRKNDFYNKKGFLRESFLVRTHYNKMAKEIVENRDELERVAYYDEVTGSPNRIKAKNDFENLKQLHPQLYVVYMDIKRFGIINENFGYETGNVILREIYTLVNEQMGYLYRVEADEFLMLVPNKKKAEIEQIVINIKNTLQQKIMVRDHFLNIRTNYGAVKCFKNSNFEELISTALLAMRENKRDYINAVTFYTIKDDKHYKKLSKIELNIYGAINDDEFSTVMQPIVNIESGEIRGFEMLSRWNSREFGVISPNVFIPLLEKNNLISDLDLQVLKKGLQSGKYIRDKFKKDYVISVNMSVETVMLHDFTLRVLELLNAFKYPAHLLEIEITESTFIYDFDSIKSKMKKLKKHGIKFSEDDFGDGYSSLTYLSRLDLDTLKISKNFVDSLEYGDDSRYLIETIIQLAQKLGYKTIVEGIETKEMLNTFKKYGCDYVQGYIYYKPMTQDSIIDLLLLKNKGDE